MKTQIVVVICIIIILLVFFYYYKNDNEITVPYVKRTHDDKILVVVTLPSSITRRDINTLLHSIFVKSYYNDSIKVVLLAYNYAHKIYQSHINKFTKTHDLEESQINLVFPTAELTKKTVQLYNFQIPKVENKETEQKIRDSMNAKIEKFIQKGKPKSNLNKYNTILTNVLINQQELYSHQLFFVLQKYWTDEKYICTFEYPFELSYNWDTHLRYSYEHKGILSWQPAIHDDNDNMRACFPVLRENTLQKGQNQLHCVMSEQFRNFEDTEVPLFMCNMGHMFCTCAEMYIYLNRLQRTFGKMLLLYSKFKIGLTIYENSETFGLQKHLKSMVDGLLSDNPMAEMMSGGKSISDTLTEKLEKTIETFNTMGNDSFVSDQKVEFSQINTWENIGMTLMIMCGQNREDTFFEKQDNILMLQVIDFLEDPETNHYETFILQQNPIYLYGQLHEQTAQKIFQATEIKNAFVHKALLNERIYHPSEIIEINNDVLLSKPANLRLCTAFLKKELFNPLKMIGMSMPQKSNGISLYQFNVYLNKMGISELSESYSKNRSYFGINWRRKEDDDESLAVEIFQKYDDIDSIFELVKK